MRVLFIGDIVGRNARNLAYKKIINHGLNSGNDLILRRVLSRDGVSKAFVNDNLVTANFLKELGLILVEIHGQNEKIGLFDLGNHILIIGFVLLVIFVSMNVD